MESRECQRRSSTVSIRRQPATAPHFEGGASQSVRPRLILHVATLQVAWLAGDTSTGRVSGSSSESRATSQSSEASSSHSSNSLLLAVARAGARTVAHLDVIMTRVMKLTIAVAGWSTSASAKSRHWFPFFLATKPNIFASFMVLPFSNACVNRLSAGSRPQ